MTVAKLAFRGLKAIMTFMASGASALRPEFGLPVDTCERWSTGDEMSFRWSVADEAAVWLYVNS